MWKVILYFCILVVVVVLQKRLSLKRKWLLVSVAVVMLLWPARPEFAITFLDVGQGDCIHIESEEGNHYLIDGGSSSVSGVGEYRILPYLKSIGVNELSAVFVTHPDKDHCNGILELLAMDKKKGILVKKLYLPDVGAAARTESYQAVEKAASKAGIEVGYFSKGMCLKDGELELICLHPGKGLVTESENAYSLVFLLEYGQFRVLLTGDVEGEGEEDLIKVLADAQELDVTVLKVAHHGSKYSTGTDFLQLVNPEIAVISCGENNSYGHPHEETLKRLADAESKIFTTPECGAITVHVRDNTCYVEAYREVKEAYP